MSTYNNGNNQGKIQYLGQLFFFSAIHLLMQQGIVASQVSSGSVW